MIIATQKEYKTKPGYNWTASGHQQISNSMMKRLRKRIEKLKNCPKKTKQIPELIKKLRRNYPDLDTSTIIN